MKNGNYNDPVNHPAHYTDGKIEVIDFIEDKALGFHLGNAVKYIARAGKKNPAKRTEDLQKAAWYLNREIANASGLPPDSKPLGEPTLAEYGRKKAIIESCLPLLCKAENSFFKSLEYAVQVNDGAVQAETVTLQFYGAAADTLDVTRTSIANIAIAVLQRVSSGN